MKILIELIVMDLLQEWQIMHFFHEMFLDFNISEMPGMNNNIDF